MSCSSLSLYCDIQFLLCADFVIKFNSDYEVPKWQKRLPSFIVKERYLKSADTNFTL